MLVYSAQAPGWLLDAVRVKTLEAGLGIGP